MAHLTGLYTLMELCTNLDLSPPWVKKVEKILGIKWGSGQKGKRSFYNDEKYYFFKKISTMRKIGYGLQEIKMIYDIEKKIVTLIRKHFPAFMEIPAWSDEAQEKQGINSRFFVSIYLYRDEQLMTSVLSYDRDKCKQYRAEGKEEADVLAKYVADYTGYMKSYSVEINKFAKAIKNEEDFLKDMSLYGPDKF